MRGFTLLEMMTTLAIFGLVATLSIASLGPLKDRYSHQQAVEMVSGAIVRAQLMARESGRCHAVQAYLADGTTATTAFGPVLLILRRPTVHCGDAGTAPDLVAVESLRLPEGTSVRIVTASGVMEVRPNGRLKLTANVQVQVRGRQAHLLSFVVSTPHGPICVRNTSGGACP